MKIRMIVIDPELSTRAKRALATLLVPVLVVAAGAVAYASVPHVWNNGDVLHAADLNENFAKIPTTTTWQVAARIQCVDEVGSPIPSQSTQAVWRREGDTMQIRLKTTFSGQTMGNLFLWEIPENHAVDPSKLLGSTQVGSGSLFRHAQGGYDFSVLVDAAGNPSVVRATWNGRNVGAGLWVPFTGGEEIQLEFSLPIQGWSLNGP